MTREEIKQMVNTCDSYHGCGCCPYSPEDISRFIGDRWKGGCPNYDRKLVYAMGKGYGDVSEYEAEIERLKAENANLLKICEEKITFDTTQNNKYSVFNTVRKEFAEKLKQRSYCDNCFKDGKWHKYVFVDEIDELLKEYKK